MMAPLIALEFARGNGEEERDRTPLSLSTEGTALGIGIRRFTASFLNQESPCMRDRGASMSHLHSP
jgi:hypothetical protein